MMRSLNPFYLWTSTSTGELEDLSSQLRSLNPFYLWTSTSTSNLETLLIINKLKSYFKYLFIFINKILTIS